MIDLNIWCRNSADSGEIKNETDSRTVKLLSSVCEFDSRFSICSWGGRIWIGPAGEPLGLSDGSR